MIILLLLYFIHNIIKFLNNEDDNFIIMCDDFIFVCMSKYTIKN